jgi:hypothetical protein
MSTTNTTTPANKAIKSFKRSQKVRTSRAVTFNGVTYPANLRLDIMRQEETGQYKATIRDPQFPALSGTRILVAPSRLKMTYRGRPKTVAVEKAK